jgi:hypothetical protein
MRFDLMAMETTTLASDAAGAYTFSTPDSVACMTLFRKNEPGTSNAPPAASAGPDQTVTDDNLDDAADVTLDGTGSSDDGTITRYVWSSAGSQIATGAAPDVTLAVGVHVITLTVEDDEGATDTDTVRVVVLYQDDDSDGMPDTWEVHTFGDTSVADATSDFDADGFTDAVEYVNGTDPRDGTSFPAAAAGQNGLSCVAGGGGAAQLAFVLAALASLLGKRRC